MRICLSLLISVCSLLSFSQDSTYTQSRDWLLPDYAKVQFAGNIGFLSLGVGYQFLNERLNSELIYGFVPKSISKAEPVHTITIKNTLPFFIRDYKTITISPITGFTFSFDTGNNSTLILPDKYPKGYYFTNAFHFTIFVGANVHKDFVNPGLFKGVDFYFELGTVEKFLWYAFKYEEVMINDVLSTAIGLNLYF